MGLGRYIVDAVVLEGRKPPCPRMSFCVLLVPRMRDKSVTRLDPRCRLVSGVD